MLTEGSGEQISIAVPLEDSAKDDTEVQDVHHDKLAGHDVAFRDPNLHLGQMIGDGKIAGARHDDGLQLRPPLPSRISRGRRRSV